MVKDNDGSDGGDGRENGAADASTEFKALDRMSRDERTPAAAAVADDPHPPGGCRGRRQAEPPWLIIQTNGRLWPGRFATRLAAIRDADRNRSFTTKIVFVKHTRSGETWKRVGGSWHKDKEGKRG